MKKNRGRKGKRRRANPVFPLAITKTGRSIWELTALAALAARKDEDMHSQKFNLGSDPAGIRPGWFVRITNKDANSRYRDKVFLVKELSSNQRDLILRDDLLDEGLVVDGSATFWFMKDDVRQADDVRPGDRVGIGSWSQPQEAAYLGLVFEVESVNEHGICRLRGYPVGLHHDRLRHEGSDAPLSKVEDMPWAQMKPGQRRILRVPDPVPSPWPGKGAPDQSYIDFLSSLRGKPVTLQVRSDESDTQKNDVHRGFRAWHITEKMFKGSSFGPLVREEWLGDLVESCDRVGGCLKDPTAFCKCDSAPARQPLHPVGSLVRVKGGNRVYFAEALKDHFDGKFLVKLRGKREDVPDLDASWWHEENLERAGDPRKGDRVRVDKCCTCINCRFFKGKVATVEDDNVYSYFDDHYPDLRRLQIVHGDHVYASNCCFDVKNLTLVPHDEPITYRGRHKDATDDCRACEGSGWNTKGDPCRICEAKASKKESNAMENEKAEAARQNAAVLAKLLDETQRALEESKKAIASREEDRTFLKARLDELAKAIGTDIPDVARIRLDNLHADVKAARETDQKTRTILNEALLDLQGRLAAVTEERDTLVRAAREREEQGLVVFLRRRGAEFRYRLRTSFDRGQDAGVRFRKAVKRDWQKTRIGPPVLLAFFLAYLAWFPTSLICTTWMDVANIETSVSHMVVPTPVDPNHPAQRDWIEARARRAREAAENTAEKESF